jgi:Tol biopolymer transport system component
VVNQDGGGRRHLTQKLSVLSFDLSPDGRQIALSAVETPGTRDIYLLRADGTRLRKLTNEHGAMNEDPRWSPDGRLLAFTRREHFGAQADIYVMRADGADRKRLTQSPLDDLAPAWQPDG